MRVFMSLELNIIDGNYKFSGRSLSPSIEKNSLLKMNILKISIKTNKNYIQIKLTYKYNKQYLWERWELKPAPQKWISLIKRKELM